MDEERSETMQAGSRRFKKILSALALFLLALFFFVAGLMLFLRIGLNDQLLTRLIVSQLRHSLQREVSLASAHLSWLSADAARIYLRGLEIRESGDQGAVLRVPKIVLDVSPFHAILGTARIGSARFTEPVFIMPVHQRVGNEHATLPPKARGRTIGIWPVLERLEIDGGSVRVRSAEENGSERVLLSDIGAVALELTPGAVRSFTVSAVVDATGKAGSLRAAGHLSGTPWSPGTWKGELDLGLARCPFSSLNILSSYFSEEFPFSEGLVDCQGHVTGDTTNAELTCDLHVYGATLSSGRLFSRPISVDEARMKLAMTLQNGTVRVDVPEIALPGLVLSAEASINGVKSQDPALELSVRKADFLLEKVFPLIPFNLLRAEDRGRLVQAGLTGHLVVTGARWTGTLSEVRESAVRKGMLGIDAYLDKVSGFVPGYGLPIKDATGRIRLSADEMIFNGVSLILGTSPIVLNGWITNLRTSPKTDLFLSLSAQGQDLIPVLENQAVASQLGPWLAGISEPQGGISVTLAIKGDLKRPVLTGKVVLDNFQCRVPQFPLLCKSINGSLRFRGAEVVFSGLKGVVGESPVEFSGAFSSDKVDVAGEAHLMPSDLKQVGGLTPFWEVSGRIPLMLTLKGDRAVTGFSLKSDLRDNTIRGGAFIRKNAGVRAEIEVSGVCDSTGVGIEEAYLFVDQNRISAKGRIGADGKVTVVVNLPPKGIPTTTLIPIVHPGYDLQPGGRLEGDAVLRLDTARPRDFSLEANLTLNYISLQLGFRKRVDGLSGSVRCRGRSLSLTVERAKIGDSELSGTLFISDFYKPRVEVAIQCPFLDTTDFTAPAGQPSRSTWSDWIRTNPAVVFLAHSTGTGSFKVVRGKTAVRAFSDLHAQFEDNHGLIKASQWHLRFADGIIRGDALFDIRANTTRPIRLDFQADRLKMARTLLADPERFRVDGDVNAEGYLEWLTNPKPENQGVHKTGHIEVRIQDGIIHRFEVLTKISSLINLGSLLKGRFPDLLTEGLPFHRMTWTMDVFDTKWKFKDLKLFSDATRIDASGMWFSDQERIDFKVDVSPLVGIDTIVSGLLGNLIAKDGKTLTTTFRVRGLLASPDVRLDLRLEPFENSGSEKD
jgi:hypothetical protein